MAIDPNAGPLPNFPATVDFPNIRTTSEQDGTFPATASLSFYYAGISSIWIWYRAPLELLRAYLNPLGMTPYDFGNGEGAVNVNFFNAVALYGLGQPGNKGVGGFNETELNIVGCASAVTLNVPQGLTLEQYLLTGDPTKRVGNYRVWVACDDAIAVAAGRAVFMENKFLMDYEYNVPGANFARPEPKQFTWDWIASWRPAPTEPAQTIYSAVVALDGLSPVLGNASEIIDLSFDTASRRPVGSRRNYLGLFDTYLQPAVANAVTLSAGDSEHPMVHDISQLIGDAKPVALQVYRSPTCIAEAAGYYADL